MNGQPANPFLMLQQRYGDAGARDKFEEVCLRLLAGYLLNLYLMLG